jgi:phage shock protein PspC (stress-responsive transcriptional regulator)
MNKTISVNISGFAFHIEEQAHETLSRYLKTIRGYFTSADGVDEIMADIEARIAEIFQERLADKRDVVDQADVNHAISILGQPEAFIDEESTGFQAEEPQHRTGRKRIFRDPDNSTVAGVAAGIAAYFGWDPVWIRLVFVLLTIGGFAGIPIYIILWIIMPEAKTPSEKLEMRGEPVTVENIGKKVAESFENVKETVNDLTGKKGAGRSSQRLKNGIEYLVNLIVRIAVLFFKAIAKLIGAILVIIGVVFLFVIVMMLFGDVSSINISGDSFQVQRFSDLTNLIFSYGTTTGLFMAGLILTVAIPILALLYAGIKLLFNIKHQFKFTGLGLTLLWVVGICLLVFVGIRTGKDFGQQQSFSETIRLNEMHSDTLVLDIMNDVHFSNHIKNNFRNGQPLQLIKTENGTVYSGHVQLNVIASNTISDSTFVINITRSARGETQKNAIDRAEKIEYQYEVQDGLIKFSPFYSFPLEDRYRVQVVEVIVQVPVGKAVYLSDNMTRIIYDIKNTTNTYDDDMVGLTWTMTPEGLTCIGCSLDDSKRWKRSR